MLEEVQFFEDNIELKENDQVFSYKAIILENSYLRLSILPKEGGKIVSIFDKRIQLEILEEDRSLEFFIEISNKKYSQWSELRYEFYTTEEGEGQLLMIQQGIGQPLTFYKSVILSSLSATFKLELKCFNASWQSLEMNTGLLGSWEKTKIVDSFLWDQENKIGLTFLEDQCFFEKNIDQDKFEWIHLGEKYSFLNPRSWRSWNIIAVPISKGLTPLKINSECYIGYDHKKLSLQSTCLLKNHKLILKDDREQMFETSLDLYPENVQFYDLDEFKYSIVEGALRNSISKKDVIVFDFRSSRPEQVEIKDPYMEMVEAWKEGKGFHKLAQCVIASGSRQSVAYHLSALQCMQNQQWQEASSFLLEALGYYAEDPGLWWLKAICERMLGEVSESLHNLNYLSPMDPLLQAEKFLSQGLVEEKESSDFEMFQDEETKVFVVCRYLEAGMWSDAICLIGKYVKEEELSRLRVLLAWSYLHRKEMRIEAELILRQVSEKWIGSLPWDWIEEKAVQEIKQIGIKFNN